MIDWKFILRKQVLWRVNGHFPEPVVLNAMRQVRGEVFFDVGANNGMFSLALQKNFKRIMAFEPDARIFSELMRRTMPKGNIMPLCLAVSDKDGWATLYSAEDGSTCPTMLEGMHYCPASNPSIDTFVKTDRSVNVRSISIDYAMKEYGFSYLDMMKIDVEGAEFLVLKSAHNALEAGKIGRMMIELHNRQRKVELETILEKNEFEFHWIDPDHVFATHN